MSLLKIWPDLNESRQDLVRSIMRSRQICVCERGEMQCTAKFWRDSNVGLLDSVFHEKTHQPTRRFQFLDMEIRRRPSQALSRTILVWTGQFGQLGQLAGKTWTPLKPIILDKILAIFCDTFSRMNRLKKATNFSFHN